MVGVRRCGICAEPACRPSTDLESDLQRILSQFGFLDEAAMEKEETELAANHLSVEGAWMRRGGAGCTGPQESAWAEVAKRRTELMRMKSLLFYHERKMKHMNKIKSKSYRKLRKVVTVRPPLAPARCARRRGAEAEGTTGAVA